MAEGFLIVGFIAAAGVVCILPLVLAPLVVRGAALAVAGSLVFLGLATWAELPVFHAVARNTTAAGGPVMWHFAAINAFQAAWVLAITLLVRWGGYRLTMSPSPTGGGSSKNGAALARGAAFARQPGGKLP